MSNRSSFLKFIDILNTGTVDELSLAQCIHSPFSCNGKSSTLAQYRGIQPDESVTVETLVENEVDGMLAARLRVKVTQNDASFEYARHMVCKFSSGKIEELYDILDTDERQQRKLTIEPVPAVPSRLSDPPAVDLVQFYKDYLACINGRTMKSDLHRFCQPQVTWGGRPHALDEYRMLMEDSFDAISGLRFNLRYIIVDAQKQQIATRLDFAGTPVKEYAGAQPTGRSVQFSEHAFYWLENGKIAAVLTVIDWDSYRRQLVGEHIEKSSESEKA